MKNFNEEELEMIEQNLNSIKNTVMKYISMGHEVKTLNSLIGAITYLIHLGAIECEAGNLQVITFLERLKEIKPYDFIVQISEAMKDREEDPESNGIGSENEKANNSEDDGEDFVILDNNGFIEFNLEERKKKRGR